MRKRGETERYKHTYIQSRPMYLKFSTACTFYDLQFHENIFLFFQACSFSMQYVQASEINC